MVPEGEGDVLLDVGQARDKSVAAMSLSGDMVDKS